jgi:hypothetical protein
MSTMQTTGVMYLVLLLLTAEGICSTCQRHKDIVCIFLKQMHGKAPLHALKSSHAQLKCPVSTQSWHTRNAQAWDDVPHIPLSHTLK